MRKIEDRVTKIKKGDEVICIYQGGATYRNSPIKDQIYLVISVNTQPDYEEEVWCELLGPTENTIHYNAEDDIENYKLKHFKLLN